MANPFESPTMHRCRTGKMLEEANEEQYLHVGVDHLTAIGDSSASLGLISTLVLGISVSSIDTAVHAWRDLFLALALSFSTYTTTYSLLEYYYVQTLKGVDSFMASRMVEVGASPEVSLLSVSEQEATPSRDDPRDTLLSVGSPAAHTSKRGSQGIKEDRALLMRQVEDAFASFNSMRMWARNSMWCSLMCVGGSTIAKIDPSLGHGDNKTSSVKTAAFFAVMLLSLAFAMAAGFTSKDIKAYLGFSAVGMMASAAAHCYAEPELPTAKIGTSLVLMLGIMAVPLTVQKFRLTYLPMTKAHTRIL